MEEDISSFWDLHILIYYQEPTSNIRYTKDTDTTSLHHTIIRPCIRSITGCWTCARPAICAIRHVDLIICLVGALLRL